MHGERYYLIIVLFSIIIIIIIIILSFIVIVDSFIVDVVIAYSHSIVSLLISRRLLIFYEFLRLVRISTIFYHFL